MICLSYQTQAETEPILYSNFLIWLRHQLFFRWLYWNGIEACSPAAMMPPCWSSRSTSYISRHQAALPRAQRPRGNLHPHGTLRRRTCVRLEQKKQRNLCPRARADGRARTPVESRAPKRHESWSGGPAASAWVMGLTIDETNLPLSSEIIKRQQGLTNIISELGNYHRAHSHKHKAQQAYATCYEMLSSGRVFG